MGALYAEKHLSDNLQPLVRFLRTCVGRSWDKVHSEIAEHVRFTNAVQQHVLQHLRQFVEEHPKMLDGVPHDPASSLYFTGVVRSTKSHHHLLSSPEMLSALDGMLK